MKLTKKFREYMDWYAFVNKQEVEMAACDYLQEEMWVESLSIWEAFEATEAAEKYIKEKGLKFWPDLVITIDKKEWCIHLYDLNWEFNEAQVKRMEKVYNAAFLNACDCLKYGYGKEAWNDCGLKDDEARARVWRAAITYLTNSF